ncbi:hypothetical protein GCM10010168_04870 [Actinoplanes ianthinogenes]|uniref:LTD domain-containing protein n=1 Tax=Actinoplanes ianthinogenes TaxID=122358 RepID=A0ABN6CB61_9ACTN|nr:lamin tail domain-containing protein [Actinoplanes ianthinogenes]BCJ42772.1 hypothetical protein Aiant_34290 [Actinoplanes ianthinogenes]GGQ92304.1 hypothetical protein GCM10010168_04870 [Actinoplanes ianthinogenes]
MFQLRKVIIGLGGAAGLLGATLPAPVFAAQLPTFNRIPVANGFDDQHPITLSGTAQPGDTVTLYEEAYIYGAKHSKTELAQHPANDYSKAETSPGVWPPLTTKADSSGHWSIKRPLDSGHVMMVGTDDGWSNRRFAAVRVQPELSASATGDNAVAFTVTVNPGEPTLPVTIQRYTSGGWTRVTSGTVGEDPIQYRGSATGQPGGTPAYRAFVSDSAHPDWADPDNFVIANYSANVTVTVPGTAGPTPAPAAANPVPNPAWTDPDSASTPTPAPGTPAAGSVRFTRIQYNAPGRDRRTNASIDGEYFRLTGKTSKTVALTGWTVRDRAGNTYTFGSYSLGAGKSVTVRTGKGTNSTSTRYWGKTYHVWNNGGDSATLRAGGTTIDSCSWSSAGKGYTTC